MLVPSSAKGHSSTAGVSVYFCLPSRKATLMSVAVSLLRRGCWTEAHRLGPKRPLVDHVRDLLEAELKLIASPSKLYTSAAEWRAWHQLFALPPAAAARWPF